MRAAPRESRGDRVIITAGPDRKTPPRDGWRYAAARIVTASDGVTTAIAGRCFGTHGAAPSHIPADALCAFRSALALSAAAAGCSHPPIFHDAEQVIAL
ncbi:hypothetical protein OH687_02680 [Burkholderia anthina]|nr:hypothetical protein OH687_02680 [Burkholderia anthina]